MPASKIVNCHVMVTKEEVINYQFEGKVSAPSVSRHDKSSENNEDLKAVSVGAHTVLADKLFHAEQTR